MKRVTTMQADELEEGMRVQHPAWAGTERVAPLISAPKAMSVGGRLELEVDGATPWTVYDNDYITVHQS